MANVPLLPLDIFAPAPLIIVTSVGSNSNVPVWPLGARVLTLPWKSKLPFPETSTKPPLPPLDPPWASTEP